MIIAMIPARMGSQRLKQKNLRELAGVPLITRAIRKCKSTGVFDQVFVNSEHAAFGDIARDEGVAFHQRPERLGDNASTSEEYIAEFLERHDCEWLVQVHSIAPLVTVDDIRSFVSEARRAEHDCLLGVEPIQIECVYKGDPVNFTFAAKTNSQDLEPVFRVSWSLTAWRRSMYLDAARRKTCATYAGRIGFYPLSRFAGHVIKTEEDLQVAAALLPLVPGA
jgi:CMP-N-acetylneuraminic acid synthetase